MLVEEDAELISTDEFINYPRSIKGVETAVFIKQNIRDDNVVNISFRSTGNVDVNKIASRLGGGGHKKASGCRLECPVDEAYAKVLDEIRAELSVCDG
jgi:phosphoesterase RecJ-like protein